MHFRETPDEEWTSAQREDIIKAIADRYKVSEGRNLQVFGISSKTLEEYLTSEKDVKLKVSRVPGQ